ncbi:hypothetical protein EV181_007841, partial [Coemansia sp. RSA 532]
RQAKLTGGIRKTTLLGDAVHRLKDGKNADGILRIDGCSMKQLEEVRQAVLESDIIATRDPGHRVLFQFLDFNSTANCPKTLRATSANQRHHIRQ